MLWKFLIGNYDVIFEYVQADLLTLTTSLLQEVGRGGDDAIINLDMFCGNFVWIVVQLGIGHHLIGPI